VTALIASTCTESRDSYLPTRRKTFGPSSVPESHQTIAGIPLTSGGTKQTLSSLAHFGNLNCWTSGVAPPRCLCCCHYCHRCSRSSHDPCCCSFAPPSAHLELQNSQVAPVAFATPALQERLLSPYAPRKATSSPARLACYPPLFEVCAWQMLLTLFERGATSQAQLDCRSLFGAFVWPTLLILCVQI